jgi:uncharacterized protein YuzE
VSEMPCVTEDGLVLRIVISAGIGQRSERFDCILDRDDFNDLIGVEILSFNEQLRATVPSAPACRQLRWSYDSEMDAFYLHVREGRATHQDKAVAIASIDKDDVLVSMEFRRDSDEAID